MSQVYENRKTIREINNLISQYKPDDDVMYYFVLGYPRSDIGKGTLVAQLLSVSSDNDAIKFDGLLNTNENGRHTAVGHDDFGVYEKFNEGRKWGREHYLLGGELYRDFINEYGENENLQINPHLSLYIEYRIHKMWNDIGKPKNLFIEVGGLITDPEVDPIFSPMIQRISEREQCRVILLSESAYNGEYIKTKTIQSAVEALLERRIRPWLLFARDTKDMMFLTLSQRLDNERIIGDKIKNMFNINAPIIISIPYFDDLSLYTDYIKKRFLPVIQEYDKNKIFIATQNSSKLDDFKLYLSDEYELSSIKDYEDKIEVVEGMTSIEENALAKAKAWCSITGKICLGDDTGFFIHELNGQPGVAIRRWAGELDATSSNEDFWLYLQKKTKDLKDYSCHFEQCVAIVTPDGKQKIIRNINQGILNKESLKKEYNGTGYPLGAAFESIGRKKSWDEMTDKEKKEFDKEFIQKLKMALKELAK